MTRGGGVAVVRGAGADLLATSKAGSLVALVLVVRFVPAACSDYSVVRWQSVDFEFYRLGDLPAHCVF